MNLIRRGPLLIAAALLLPLIIFAAIQLAFSAREQRREVEARALADAATLVVQSDALLSRTLGALDAIATIPSFTDGDHRRAYARTREIAALNPEWVTVTYYNYNRGELIFDLRHAFGSTLPQSGILVRPRANLPDKAVAGGMGGGGAGCPCVLAHRIIKGPGGQISELTAAIDPRRFQALARAAAVDGRVVGIVDGEGRFIARSVGFEQRVGQPGSVFLRGAVSGGAPRGIYSGQTLEGFVNYSAFVRSALSGWSAHIAFEPNLLDAPRVRSLAAAGLAAFAALALAILLIWFTLRQLAEGRRVERRIQESQKLEALGQLTGGIAHDFNNLLTPILGGLDMISRKEDLDDRTRRMVQGALASARKAAKLTGQLLAFSRRQRLQIGPVDLKALLAGMEPLLRQSAGPGTVLAIDVAHEARCVLSDSNQLELALLNLVLNARDALPDGGSIRIAAGRQPGGDKVILTVADDGVGMAPDVLRRAAEPFYTTKPSGAGTGLGLAQVHGIVEQSGGSLTIDSEEGRGTKVTILLPGCELAPEPIPAPSGIAEARPSDNLRILVCDDDDAVRAIVARTLEEAGYAVESVSDGRTAVAAARNSRPDLLVVDFAMPVMNGAEVARAVGRLPDPPAVLVITGYADSEALKAVGDGVAILRKPFEADSLLEAVERALGP